MEIRLPAIEELKEKMKRNPNEFIKGTIYWTSEEHKAPQYRKSDAYGIFFDPDSNFEHVEYSYSKNTPYDKKEDKATSKYIVVTEKEEGDLEWIDAKNVSIPLGGVSWNDSMNEINHYTLEHE